MKIRVLVFLFRLTVIAIGVLAGFQTLHVEAAIQDNVPDSYLSQALQQNQDMTAGQVSLADVSTASCTYPTPEKVEECKQLERQILASTVRVEWNLWVAKDGNSMMYTCVRKSIGHATIKEGRYLVTHNHWDLLLSDLGRGERVTLSVFSATGKPIWLETPLEVITIVEAGSETLVLDFGDFGAQGLFALLGIPSAEFMIWEAIPVQSGMEVAQVNWDGTTARVDWVTVDEVIIRNGVARLELVSTVIDGTSGGGVFWNGYHIANTWYRVTERRFWDGKLVRQYSVAALNPPTVAVP